jgi:hypothetical protein
VLNLIVLLVIVAQFEVFAVASRIGRGLRRVAEAQADLPIPLADKKSRIHALRPYVEIYVISKLLVVVFLANMYTWRSQQPDFAGMVALSSILVAVLGTAVVSYPRYHVQYWLFRIESRDVTAEYPDIRATMAAGLASLTDLLILGTAMTNLLLNVLQSAGIHIRFF